MEKNTTRREKKPKNHSRKRDWSNDPYYSKQNYNKPHRSGHNLKGLTCTKRLGPSHRIDRKKQITMEIKDGRMMDGWMNYIYDNS